MVDVEGIHSVAVTALFFAIPVPDWALVKSLADRYERTGEGETEFAAMFERTLEIGEILATYAVPVAGRPSRS